MLRSAYFLPVVILILVTLGPGQTKSSSDEPANSILLEKTKPSAYISFEKIGKAPPLFKGETEDRYWLRLSNNTRGDITFCYSDVQKLYGDVIVRYDIEKENSTGGHGGLSSGTSEKSMDKNPLPSNEQTIGNGYAVTDACLIYTLRSGASVLFSIPKVHLTFHGDAFRITVLFNYGWESATRLVSAPPKHVLSFSYSNLPSFARN